VDPPKSNNNMKKTADLGKDKVSADALGKYEVIKDIAEGTFGKVKSKWRTPLLVWR